MTVIGQVTAAKDYGVTMIGAGKPTTVLLDQRPRTMSGLHGGNGVSAASPVEAQAQGAGHVSASDHRREAWSAPDKQTQRPRIATPLLVGLTLESGAPVHCHGIALRTYLLYKNLLDDPFCSNYFYW